MAIDVVSPFSGGFPTPNNDTRTRQDTQGENQEEQVRRSSNVADEPASASQAQRTETNQAVNQASETSDANPEDDANNREPGSVIDVFA